jgi:RNA polymerase sigma-70 factor (ECF subfamily)
MGVEGGDPGLHGDAASAALAAYATVPSAAATGTDLGYSPEAGSSTLHAMVGERSHIANNVLGRAIRTRGPRWAVPCNPVARVAPCLKECAACDPESPGADWLSMDLERLHAEHGAALRRYLARYTGDAHLAEDAAQEAYLRFLRRPPRPGVDPRAWLFRVATNVVRDGWRRWRTAALAAEVDVPAPAARPDPCAELEAEERRRIALWALSRMSSRYRQVLVMREEGFTYKFIAQALGISPNSVGPIACRALLRMRELLERRFPEAL